MMGGQCLWPTSSSWAQLPPVRATYTPTSLFQAHRTARRSGPALSGDILILSLTFLSSCSLQVPCLSPWISAPYLSILDFHFNGSHSQEWPDRFLPGDPRARQEWLSDSIDHTRLAGAQSGGGVQGHFSCQGAWLDGQAAPASTEAGSGADPGLTRYSLSPSTHCFQPRFSFSPFCTHTRTLPSQVISDCNDKF